MVDPYNDLHLCSLLMFRKLRYASEENDTFPRSVVNKSHLEILLMMIGKNQAIIIIPIQNLNPLYLILNLCFSYSSTETLYTGISRDSPHSVK